MSTRNSFPDERETPSRVNSQNIKSSDDTRLDAVVIDDPADDTAHTPRNGALWLMLSLLAFYAVFSLGAWSQKHSSQPPVIGPISSHDATTSAKIVVHVAGAVRRPGVYTLESNARIFHALDKAGGALANGDTGALNLADWAQDGTRIEVPFKASKQTQNPNLAPLPASSANVAAPESASETSPQETSPSETASPLSTSTPDGSSTRTPRAVVSQPRVAKRETKAASKAKTQSKTIAGLPRALTPDGKLSNNASPQYLEQHPLDLNKITREQLEALPGVGPSLAQKILDYRTQNNGFKNVEELDNVSGIGAKKLAALKPLLYVVGAEAVSSPTLETAN